MPEIKGYISEMKREFSELIKEVQKSNILLQTLRALNKEIEKKFSVVYINKKIHSK